MSEMPNEKPLTLADAIEEFVNLKIERATNKYYFARPEERRKPDDERLEYLKGVINQLSWGRG